VVQLGDTASAMAGCAALAEALEVNTGVMELNRNGNSICYGSIAVLLLQHRCEHKLVSVSSLLSS
jgi:hypothetical protein